MPQFSPLYYAPDIDNAWSVAPGALADLNGFAPLQSGYYGSVGISNYFGSSNLTGSDIVSAYAIRQHGGSVRFFVNRATNLDEYDAAASRTNRATGLTSATDWHMCAQGNAVIACAINNATQVSTGAGFSALGGGSPKARLCASNLGFIMLADVDDGASNVFGDMVWWSALYNYASFAPAIATEAGYKRLLEAPGRITALMPFRDGFVAFKDNALFVGEYIGPNYIWAWRCLSHRIGCVGPRAVVELDGKLVFLHASGVYTFDGQNIQNVGLPVNQTLLAEAGFTVTTGAITNASARGIYYTHASADDVDGVAWFHVPYTFVNAGTRYATQLFGYNIRANKWGRAGNRPFVGNLQTGGSSGTHAVFVNATTADMQSFLADSTARVWMAWNDPASTLQAIRYPFAAYASGGGTAAFLTGVFGSNDGSSTLKEMHHRTINPTDDDPGIIVAVTGYTTENKNKANGAAAPIVNTEFDVVNCVISSRFRTVQYGWTSGKKVILGGLAPAFELSRR